MPTPSTPAVRRTLEILGADIGAARRRRRLPLTVVAGRAGLSRQTVAKIEKGDGSVAMGAWATVLLALNLHERLRGIADPSTDTVGIDLETERLPQRVHLRRRKDP